jgi:Gpi18-like mannosyltransferase
MNPDRPGASPVGSRGHPVVPWLRIASYFFASRVFLYVIANLSVWVIAKGTDDRSRAPLDLFKRWDADWYLGVARNGYAATAHGASTAFFPLYPLLMRFVGFLCHDLRVAGYLISNACLLGSCLMLWKLAARDTGRENVADRAVLFFLFNPVSLFYSSIYSESLFFLLMIGLAWFATERRWLAAGCCGCLASLTRPVGILLVSLLVFEFIAPYFARLRGKSNAPRWPDPQAPAFLASVVMTCAGLATYCLCLARSFGDPFAFMKAEAGWHRHFAMPWVPFWHSYLAFYDIWFYAAVVIGLVVLVLGFILRLRPGYLVMTCVYFLMYLSTTRLEAIPRFLSVLFPFYLVIGLVAVRYPRLEPLLLAGSVMLLTFSVILFVNGYWYT